jgi:hypothetical protein
MNELIKWVYSGTCSAPYSGFRIQIEHFVLGAICIHQKKQVTPESNDREIETSLIGNFEPGSSDANYVQKTQIIKELILDISHEEYLAEIKIYYCWPSKINLKNNQENDEDPYYEIHILQIPFSEEDDEEEFIFEEEDDEEDYD